MFAVIDAAALVDEPFSECAAFHLCTTADYLIWTSSRLRRRPGVQAKVNSHQMACCPLICVNDEDRSAARNYFERGR